MTCRGCGSAWTPARISPDGTRRTSLRARQPADGEDLVHANRVPEGATRNVFQYDINLQRNNKLTIGTCGIFGGDYDGDTFLRLKSPTWAELASDDDACGTLASNFSYVVPATGTYHIWAGCYDNKQCWGSVGILTQVP